jgi:hypothetical protein
MFLDSFTFVEKWVTKPMPILPRHVLAKEWLVLFYFRFKLGWDDGFKIEVRPGVTAERLACGTPSLEYGQGNRVFFGPDAVDKAIHGRHVLLLQSVKDGLCDLKTRDGCGSFPVCREIIESNGHLLASCR